MGIKKQAKKAVSQLESISTDEWSDKNRKAVLKIIESVIIDTVNELCERSSKEINKCCSADLDKAHKLNEELRLAREAVITNLSSMR